MKELAIVKYIKENGLDEALKAFNLKTSYGEKKVLLKYDQIESPKHLQEVKECRGLILELDTFKVMAMPFTRFFNYGESCADNIDWESANILDKVDGSLMILYFDWNISKWCIASSGQVDASGEVNNAFNGTFSELFWKTITNQSDIFKDGLDSLNIKLTYIFELTTPYNIVVTPHTESSVTLLGCRNIETLDELSYDELKIISNDIKIPLVGTNNFSDKSLSEILKTFDNMPFSEEGYVIVDKYFNRIKVKNPSYVLAHAIKGKTGSYHAITIVKNGEIDEYVSLFKDMEEELLDLKMRFDNLLTGLECAYYILQLKDCSSRKEYANEVFKLCKLLNYNLFTGLFFSLYDGKIKTVREYLNDFDDKKLFEYLKVI